MSDMPDPRLFFGRGFSYGWGMSANNWLIFPSAGPVLNRKRKHGPFLSTQLSKKSPEGFCHCLTALVQGGYDGEKDKSCRMFPLKNMGFLAKYETIS